MRTLSTAAESFASQPQRGHSGVWNCWFVFRTDTWRRPVAVVASCSRRRAEEGGSDRALGNGGTARRIQHINTRTHTHAAIDSDASLRQIVQRSILQSLTPPCARLVLHRMASNLASAWPRRGSNSRERKVPSPPPSGSHARVWTLLSSGLHCQRGHSCRAGRHR